MDFSSRDDQVLQHAVESRRLPWPMPTKWDRIKDATVLAYLEHAPDIFEELAAKYPGAVQAYADSLYEHVKARHAKMWDQALKTYALAPNLQTARWVASWLVKFCGHNQNRINTIIALIVNGDLENFMTRLNGLIPKLNQEQWDQIAPLFIDFENQKNLRFVAHKHQDKLKANGVTPWYPTMSHSRYGNQPEELTKIFEEYAGRADPLIPYLISDAILDLSPDQWDQLVSLVKRRFDKKEIQKILEIWEPEIKEQGLHRKLPWNF